MKAILAMLLLLGSFSVFACSDTEADDLVLDRAKAMAKRYNAKRIGIGFASMAWGDTRITNISIMDGDGGTGGERIDRIGAIYINMDTCVVKAKIVSIFETIELK